VAEHFEELVEVYWHVTVSFSTVIPQMLFGTSGSRTGNPEESWAK